MADGRAGRYGGGGGGAGGGLVRGARATSVVHRNWRCRDGELDLVVRRGRELVFVEVKTRRTDRFGLPAEAVTRDKQRRLRALASRYLEATGRARGSLRFDVVSILGGRLEVIEAAF